MKIHIQGLIEMLLVFCQECSARMKQLAALSRETSQPPGLNRRWGTKQNSCNEEHFDREKMDFFHYDYCSHRQPSDTGVIKDTAIVSLNLSILILGEAGREGREHVSAGAPLSVILSSSKCIRRQMTLISECYEADKRRNKAPTIRAEKSVTCRWTSGGGAGDVVI